MQCTVSPAEAADMKNSGCALSKSVANDDDDDDDDDNDDNGNNNNNNN